MGRGHRHTKQGMPLQSAQNCRGLRHSHPHNWTRGFRPFRWHSVSDRHRSHHQPAECYRTHSLQSLRHRLPRSSSRPANVCTRQSVQSYRQRRCQGTPWRSQRRPALYFHLQLAHKIRVSCFQVNGDPTSGAARCVTSLRPLLCVYVYVYALQRPWVLDINDAQHVPPIRARLNERSMVRHCLPRLSSLSPPR